MVRYSKNSAWRPRAASRGLRSLRAELLNIDRALNGSISFSRSLRLSFQSKSCFTARAYATRVLRLRIFGGKNLIKQRLARLPWARVIEGSASSPGISGVRRDNYFCRRIASARNVTRTAPSCLTGNRYSNLTVLPHRKPLLELDTSPTIDIASFPRPVLWSAHIIAPYRCLWAALPVPCVALMLGKRNRFPDA